MRDLIEHAAEELYLHDAKQTSTRWPSWKCASVCKQQKYRDRVEVVIAAMVEKNYQVILSESKEQP